MTSHLGVIQYYVLKSITTSSLYNTEFHCQRNFIWFSGKVHDMLHKYNVNIIGSDSKPVVYLDNLLATLLIYFSSFKFENNLNTFVSNYHLNNPTIFLHSQWYKKAFSMLHLHRLMILKTMRLIRACHRFR